MAHIASPIPKINELVIHRLPAGTVMPVKKAIKADGMTFLLAEDGKLYSDAVKDRAFYGLTRWRFASPLVNALTRMCIITRAEAKVHLDACNKADAVRARQEWGAQLRQSAKKLGVQLTVKQKRTMNLALYGKA